MAGSKAGDHGGLTDSADFGDRFELDRVRIERNDPVHLLQIFEFWFFSNLNHLNRSSGVKVMTNLPRRLQYENPC